jgi:hypothetical protein
VYHKHVGAAAGTALLPVTGFHLLALAAVAIIALTSGVLLLRLSMRRRAR